MVVEVALQFIAAVLAEETQLRMEEGAQRIRAVRVEPADRRQWVRGNAFVVLHRHHMRRWKRNPRIKIKSQLPWNSKTKLAKLTQRRRRRGNRCVRIVAIWSDARQVEFAFRVDVQTVLAELAIGEGFAIRGRVHKLARIAARTVREELAALQDLPNRTADRGHGHRAEH